MQASNKPKNLTVPFASGGAFNPIPTDSQVAVSPGKASFVDGFPPATRTPRAAGGIPPDGLDMNGILHDLSNAVMYQQAFGIMPWDSVFANATGYPKNAIISYNGALYQSQNDDNKAQPSNATAWGAVKGVTPSAGANDNQLATMEALQNAISNVAGALNTTGYFKLPNGIIVQYFQFTSSSSGYSTALFPIAFPNRPLAITMTPNSNNSTVVTAFVDFASSTATTLKAACLTTTGVFATYSNSIIAVGY